MKAILIIDDIEVNIIVYSLAFSQGSDVTGRPSQKPVFKNLMVTVESRKDLTFYEWMLERNLAKNFEIHIMPTILGGRIRKIYFFDGHLVNHKNNFSSTGNLPLSETLTITAGGYEDSFSSGMYEASWRVSFNEEEGEATTIDNSPELIRYYITDLDGNETDEYDVGDKIILNIETKNAIGENLTISIPDKEHDFKLNGIRLQNDTLSDYTISNDLEQIELEVIEEEA